jgi:hypothetical protein
MATWNNASKADVMLCDEVTLTLSEERVFWVWNNSRHAIGLIIYIFIDP